MITHKGEHSYHLGDIIRTARAARRISQTAFAGLVNISQPELSYIERGAQPTPEQLAAIEDALGVKLDSLQQAYKILAGAASPCEAQPNGGPAAPPH